MVVVINNNTTSYTNNYSRPKNLVPSELINVDKLFINLITLNTPHHQEYHIVRVVREYLKDKLRLGEKFKMDEDKGNMVIDIGPSPVKTLFSSHMDIVGSVSLAVEKSRIPERIYLMEDRSDIKNVGFFWGAKKSIKGEYVDSNLGADDKVGVYIMTKMIEQGIPGRYVFHVGEESGCIGSNYILNNYKKEVLDGIERAIAFDRADYGDVIAFQRNSRCSSVEFSKALADKLNKHMPPKQQFKDNVHGVFTDTAVYMDIIPECCNLSVGYFNQHGDREKVDYLWLSQILLPAILKINFEDLPTMRDPKKKIAQNYNRQGYYGSEYEDEIPYYSARNRYNKVAKKWEECNEHTPLYDLPEWQLSDGYPDGASADVFYRVVNRFIMMNAWGKKSEKFAEDLADFIEMFDLVVKENKTLREQNARQIKILKATGLLRTSNNQETHNVIDPSIDHRKQILTKLIELSHDASNYYVSTLSTYIYQAEVWIKKHNTKKYRHQYKKKDLVRLNRLIYGLSYILDLSDAKSDMLIKLLDSVSEYIKANVNDEGFMQHEVKLIEYDDKPKLPAIN